MNQRYPSALLENAVNELASLPGVGRKTALRLALYMLRRFILGMVGDHPRHVRHFQRRRTYVRQ